MHSQQTKSQFLTLRSQGWSLTRISNHLGISKPTLIKWNRQFQFALQSLRAIELEALHESILERHREDIVRLEKQQKLITRELSRRKLSDISTEKLFQLDALLRAEIQKVRALSVPPNKSPGYIPSPEGPLDSLHGDSPCDPPVKSNSADSKLAAAPTPTGSAVRQLESIVNAMSNLPPPR